MDLNQLAEFGPQNLEDAWAYFKTWVKGMPISEAVNFNHAPTRDFDRSNFGSKMPSEMMRNDPLLDTEPTATDTQWRYEWPGAQTNVKTEQNFPNANFDATYTPMRDTDASPNANFDATYTPMRDTDAVPPVDNPYTQDSAAREDRYYNRNRTTRTSQDVVRGKARQLNGESVRGVGSNLEDRDQARKGINPPYPPSPLSPTRNEEDMDDYVEFEPTFRPGDSVPQNYVFNTPPPAQPPIDDMDESETPTPQNEPFFGPNPNRKPTIDISGVFFDEVRKIPTGLDRTMPIFSHGEEAVYVAFDPLRGLEKRQVEGREFIRPSIRMVSDRKANPVFVWSAAVFKERRASQFRTQRTGIDDVEL